jgi:DNA-binding transcriptional regulator YiaG
LPGFGITHTVNHRKAMGMTQKEFARQIGVDPSTLARWERGEREPSGMYHDLINRTLAVQNPDSE